MRSQRALDLLNFFVADVQTGFGPFVAVYLTMHKWTAGADRLCPHPQHHRRADQPVPAGVLVDAAPNKRRVAGGALIGVIVAALLMAFWPSELPYPGRPGSACISSCVLTPAIAAISLHLVGHAALGERLGRNARFAAIGNGLAAAVMGVTGTYVSSQSVFLLTAALCVPALLALLAIGRGPHARRQTTDPAVRLAGLRQIVHRSATAGIRVCVLLFHMSNAAMLPLLGAAVTMRTGTFANLIIAACIVVPQAVVALLLALGRDAARRRGRPAPVLLLGWAALPLRGLLLAVLPGA